MFLILPWWIKHAARLSIHWLRLYILGDRTQAKISVDGLTWCRPFIPVLIAMGRNSLLSTHTRQVFFFFFGRGGNFSLCTLWIFIATASMLLSADLPLTSVGVLLLARVWNAWLRVAWCSWRRNFALSFLHAPEFRLHSFFFTSCSLISHSHVYALWL